jgi:FAD/FMN-containing dehydrogenase
VVVECASAYDPLEELAAAVEVAGELVLDQAAADDTAGRRAIWRLREALPEAVVRDGVPVKIDIAVPLGALARFVVDVLTVVERVAPGARTILWGHVGDGNVHVNVLHAEAVMRELEAEVLLLAASMGGSISAEHGVGVSKAEHLGLVRSPSEIELMRALKTAIDPRSIMNPGVVLPATG